MTLSHIIIDYRTQINRIKTYIHYQNTRVIYEHHTTQVFEGKTLEG